MITNKKINTYTLLFFVCLLPVFLSVAQQQQRPNILLLFADDWGRHASIYQELEGDKSHSALVKTPNFDAIAKNGVLFTNAHVNAPSCTPSRSALLSGQYFYRTGLGSILLGAQWDDQIPSYPLLLQNQGYDIGYMYKVFIDYAHAKRPYEELYDLKKDPEQLYNVAGLSPYHEAKSNLSDLMDKILIETNDPRMNENPPFENPPFTDRENDTTRWDAHLNHLKEVHESNIKTEE